MICPATSTPSESQDSSQDLARRQTENYFLINPSFISRIQPQHTFSTYTTSSGGSKSPSTQLISCTVISPKQEPTETSQQPIRTRYLGHVTGYQPIRDQYFLIRSVPAPKEVVRSSGNHGYHSCYNHAVVMKFTSSIQYIIQHCNWGNWTALPVQPGDEVDKTWTIRKTNTTLNIECNGVEVLNYQFSDSNDSDCEILVSDWLITSHVT
eukprot:sb/3470313/